MTSKETDHHGTKESDHQIAFTIAVSPAEVDAGADLTVTVRAACTSGLDLAGERVSIVDQDGRELAGIELAPATADEVADKEDAERDDEGDEDVDGQDEAAVGSATGRVVVRAPTVAGAHALRAILPAVADKQRAHAQVAAEARFVVTAHAATITTWDVSSATPAGERTSVTVGVKCSCGCNLGGRPYRLLDHEGREVWAGVLRAEVWPNTTALYHDQARATVPDAVGLHTWIAETPEWTSNGLPHDPASAAFPVNVVAAADFEITIVTLDGETQTPVKGTHVLLHPYRAMTDERGMARIKVAKGRYDLNISGFKYAAYRDVIEADDDLVLHAELFIEPDEKPYHPRIGPPPARISVLRKGQQ